MPTRNPTPSEHEFFFNNRDVPGYAAPDNHVVFNPYVMMDPRMKQAIMANEMARIAMRTGLMPQYKDPLTQQQQQLVQSNRVYGKADPQTQRDTMMARMYSGDPSGGTPNDLQAQYLKLLQRAVESMR